MKRLALLLSALSFACGPASDGASLGAAIEISGVAPGEIGSVQITVLKNAQKYLCRDLVKTCLSTQGVSADIVPVRVDKVDQKSLKVKLDGTKATGAGQTFTLDVPAGSNYVVVAEVLSPDEKGLLASGCDVRQDVTDGDNAPLVIKAAALTPVPSCDPRMQ